MTIEADLASFVTETKFRDLPEEVVEFTKQLALKTTAGMVAGSDQPAGRQMVPFVADRAGGQDEAGVFACGFRTGLHDAVFANGLFAHASELEDDKIAPAEDTSWDITTFPLTLPLAEKYRLSGKEFVVASAIGMETQTRLSLPPDRGVAPDVGLQGAPMASAAAAARCMRLNSEEVVDALGMASGGPFLFMGNTSTHAHYLDSAFQCTRGLRAAQLAKAGFTGKPDLEALFASLYGDAATDASAVVEELGEEWHFLDIDIKKYPCCFHTHRYIDTLRELLEAEDLTYDEIEEVEIEIGTQEASLCNRPDPETVDDAKFSFHQVLGAVLLEGDVGYDHIEEEAILDPRFEEARAKISVDIDPDWIQIWERPARVTVTCTDGRTITHEREHVIGSRADPLDDEQFRELYRKFTDGVLSDELVERTADDILAVEDREDLQHLVDALTYRRLAR